MKTFHCDHCGYVVFFENVVCGNCGAALGFVPAEMNMAAFEVVIDGDGSWRRLGVDAASSRAWRPCRHYAVEAVCNWMVAVGDGDDRCRSCRHTEDTPAVRDPANSRAWFKLESAKRSLFYVLYQLGLPTPGTATDGGLAFRFLDGGGGFDVTTGHLGGTITLDIIEADDAQREARRLTLGEPYRTLLGHFRHEIGHYYWDQLIAPGKWLEPFRTLFGDERADYAAATAAYYSSLPPADWPNRFISAYATMHPWEDWAETWAHYMHIADALDTAAHWGFALHSDQTSGGPADLPAVDGTGQAFAQTLIEQWLPLSQFLNSMGRSLGQGDAYPFVIAPAVVDKLSFVHDVIRDAARGVTPGTPASGPRRGVAS